MRGITYDDMRPGCWQPAARLADMDAERRRGLSCASRTTRASAVRSSCRARTRSSRSSASRPTTTGWSRSGAATAAAASSRCASCRCGTPSSPPPRSGATPPAACGPSRSASCPPSSVCPSHPLRALGPVLRGVRRDRHRRVHAHRFGHQDRRTTSDDAPDAVGAVDHLQQQRRQSMTDFLFSGVLARFPNLKLLYAECQIGWIPYVLERVDDVWQTHRVGAQRGASPELPSTYYHRRSTAASSRTRSACELLDRIGVDNVMFETDYPHQDGTWPNSVRRRPSSSATSTRRHPQDRPRQRHRAPRPRPPARVTLGARGATGDPAEGEQMTDYESVPGPARQPRRAGSAAHLRPRRAAQRGQRRGPRRHHRRHRHRRPRRGRAGDRAHRLGQGLLLRLRHRVAERRRRAPPGSATSNAGCRRRPTAWFR